MRQKAIIKQVSLTSPNDQPLLSLLWQVPGSFLAYPSVRCLGSLIGLSRGRVSSSRLQGWKVKESLQLTNDSSQSLFQASCASNW